MKQFKVKMFLSFALLCQISVLASAGDFQVNTSCAVPLSAGIKTGELQLPRAGLYNHKLIDLDHRHSGIESQGQPVSYFGCTFIKGKTSSFGGPRDRGVRADETGAISFERLRLLNNPLSPSSSSTVIRHAEKYYYAAMRVDYDSTTLKTWQEARLLIVNPKTQRSIVVRLVDWGPSPKLKGRIVDLSPQSLEDLGADTDEDVLISFAQSGAVPPLGPVDSSFSGD